MVLSIRNIAAFFVSSYYIITGKTEKVKKQAANGDFILSVYFHDPSKKLFESTVKWFLKHGYHFISVETLNDILRHQKPFPSAAVVLTADDGWKGNKENIAEVANRYKIPVTIFASTNPIETGEAYWWSYIDHAHKAGIIRESVGALKKVPNDERIKIVEEVKAKLSLQREALTIQELQSIAAGNYVSIGSHTVTHPILTTCSDEKAAKEIIEAKHTIQNWLQKDVKYFAYPNGMYTSREINILKDSGYQAAFSTIPDYIKPGTDTRDALYSIPRFDVLESVSFAENICRMTGIWFNRKAV